MRPHYERAVLVSREPPERFERSDTSINDSAQHSSAPPATPEGLNTHKTQLDMQLTFHVILLCVYTPRTRTERADNAWPDERCVSLCTLECRDWTALDTVVCVELWTSRVSRLDATLQSYTKHEFTLSESLDLLQGPSQTRKRIASVPPRSDHSVSG